jgi:hypothetical protein
MYILFLCVLSDLGSLALNSSRPYLKLNLPRLLIRADVTGFRILPDEAHDTYDNVIKGVGSQAIGDAICSCRLYILMPFIWHVSDSLI